MTKQHLNVAVDATGVHLISRPGTSAFCVRNRNDADMTYDGRGNSLQMQDETEMQRVADGSLEDEGSGTSVRSRCTASLGMWHRSFFISHVD